MNQNIFISIGSNKDSIDIIDDIKEVIEDNEHKRDEENDENEEDEEDEEDEEIKININTYLNTSFVMYVPIKCSIDSLYEDMSSRFRIDTFDMIYCDLILDRRKTISDYNMRDESNITIIPKIKTNPYLGKVITTKDYYNYRTVVCKCIQDVISSPDVQHIISLNIKAYQQTQQYTQQSNLQQIQQNIIIRQQVCKEIAYAINETIQLKHLTKIKSDIDYNSEIDYNIFEIIKNDIKQSIISRFNPAKLEKIIHNKKKKINKTKKINNDIVEDNILRENDEVEKFKQNVIAKIKKHKLYSKNSKNIIPNNHNNDKLFQIINDLKQKLKQKKSMSECL